MTDTLDPPDAPPEDPGRIVDELLTEALSKRYLAYALSTITNRALPDVRDGLKPVHRRILYGMREMRLGPDTGPKKSARVVGDVMGRYHPHGDQSIYDALVRLAQDFAQRYPLVDGQGNFGSVDGDNPAAMRYTECRLTTSAQLLLDGIDEDAVDFKPTYDGEGEEPVVLPAGFPNLLANGASGIAVGMATSIPPHNVLELLDACLELLKRREATSADLATIVPGPDFPTGGIIVESAASLREMYATGRGGVRLRARWQVEEYGKGQWRVIVTEIPYGVQKNKLEEALAALLEQKKAPLMGDVRDESAEDTRLVIEPRARNVEPEHLMESLFKLSDLEIRFPVNMNVLDARGTPRVMGLKAMLQAWLDHRREVLGRRARWRLAKVEARLHVLEGLRIAYLNLDEVIRIVRYEDQPKAKLIETFALSDIQAEYILNTRLRQLARLEEMEINREHGELTAERDGIVALLASEKQQWRLIGEGVKDVRRTLAKDKALTDRRSTLADAPTLTLAPPADAFITREPITVVLSERGWIRAVRGGVADPSELKFKEGDKLGFLVPAMTTDKLMLFASDGRAFALTCDKLPPGRGTGEPLRLMLDLDDKVKIIAAFAHRPGRKRLVASAAGYGFLALEDDMLALRRAGKQVLNLEEGGAAVLCLEADGNHVGVVGTTGKALVFPAADLPEMGRGKGVKLQNYAGVGGLKDAVVFGRAEGLAYFDKTGKRRDWKDWSEWLGKRAGAGRAAPKPFARFDRAG